MIVNIMILQKLINEYKKDFKFIILRQTDHAIAYKRQMTKR